MANAPPTDIVSRKIFIFYLSTRDRGDMNPLMLGVHLPEIFSREIMMCIMEHFGELQKAYADTELDEK